MVQTFSPGVRMLDIKFYKTVFSFSLDDLFQIFPWFPPAFLPRTYFDHFFQVTHFDFVFGHLVPLDFMIILKILGYILG